MKNDMSAVDLHKLAPFPEKYLTYNKQLLANVSKIRQIVGDARRKGLDPVMQVECETAFDLAERVQLLLGLPVAERLRELIATLRTEQAALKLAEEVALGKFGFFDKERAMDAGVRAGLAVVTEGVTVAPLQGISSVKVKSNDDGTRYVALYFAGPIRSAGGTEAAFTLVIADHIRRSLGLERYRAGAWGEPEVGRFIEELRVYERDVGNFQYKVSDEDLQYTILHLPVEVDGVETDPVEVVVHRGLRRIGTDRVRGGALRVLNDGVIGRSRKLLKLVEDLGISGWEWLAELTSGRQQSAEETRVEASHFEEVISGRPVLSFPERIGGFRLRYGRSFNTGLSTVGVHPALGAILDYPVVVGTQVKMDVPGKAGTIAFVDTIEPPIVMLRDGSVVRISDEAHASRVRDGVETILYLGDILVSYGDFLENNVKLVPSGYVEEWWVQELREQVDQRYGSVLECAKSIGLKAGRLKEIFQDYLHNFPSIGEAFLLSEKLGVPLHPRHLFFWDVSSSSEVLVLRHNLSVRSGDPDSTVLTCPNRADLKTTLEKIGIPHRIVDDSIVLDGDAAYCVLRTLNLASEKPLVTTWASLNDLLSELSGAKIMKKSSVFVGLRVGRPEKAMIRRMKPPVHLLFPVGMKGGTSRDLVRAAEQDDLEVQLISLICSQCGSHSTSARCRVCGGETKIVKRCPVCSRIVEGEVCPQDKVAALPYSTVSYPLKDSLGKAVEKVGYKAHAPLKGVQGLTNLTRIPEPIEKGILRQKHDLSVYKDGTVRFDVTNAPLTHFRASQIGTSLDKLRELGYHNDVNGDELERDDQLLELFIQDVILPMEAGQHLLKVSQYVDDLLVKLYGLDPYYRISSSEDLIGHLIVGLAPHTSAGTVGRVIGFTNSQVCFAHPLWHSSKRRDCDGDGDAIILLMDVLLNFSKEYLPSQIGGLMDAPLLLQPIVLPAEVQRQGHNLDVSSLYPLDFYKASLKGEFPQAVKGIDIVRNRLKNPSEFFGYGFTHDTGSIAGKRSRSSYTTLRSLSEKLERQIELARKIRAVDPDEVVKSVLRTHILPDIIGNIKAYSSQSFRCKACGAIHRRFPLKGVCLTCGGALQATVTRRSVEKYLALGLKLAQRFDVGDYLRQRLEIAAEELGMLFTTKREEPAQAQITEFIES